MGRNDKAGQVPREEYEVAWYTEELGRPLQRRLLQRRLDEIGDGHSVSAAGASPRDESGGRVRHDQSSREERPA